MNVILSTDNNYVQHCAVTMMSILENNTDVKIFLLTEGLTKENEFILYKLVKDKNAVLNILKVDSSFLRKVPMPKHLAHISIATYYRLFVASLLPPEVDKIIYLDCDLIVRKDLSELYNINIENYSLAAVYQDDPLLLTTEMERLNIPKDKGYFNAGVLLINLDYWRKNNIEDKLLNYIKDNYDNIVYHDQDTLNGLLYDHVYMLPCKWNMLTAYFCETVNCFTSSKCVIYRNEILSGSGADPAVVHYVGAIKPWHWESVHPFKNDYYFYLDMTSFSGWRPEPKLSLSAIKNKLRETIPFKYLPFYSKQSRILNLKFKTIK